MRVFKINMFAVQERPERPEMRSEKSDKGGKFGLKRLGTVIGRRRQSTNPYSQSRSPERKKSSSDVRSSPFSRFTRKESHQQLGTVPSPPQTAQSTFEEPSGSRSPDTGAQQLNPITSVSSQGINGTNLETVSETEHVPAPVNGTRGAVLALQEPLQPSPVTYEVGSRELLKILS
jgi:hypothetical protein